MKYKHHSANDQRRYRYERVRPIDKRHDDEVSGWILEDLDTDDDE